jgi:hypothetical protein
MKEYVILLPGDEDTWEQSSAEHKKSVYDVHREFMRRLEERSHVLAGGAELAHSRTSWVVRRDGARPVVTEGPYAESAEQLTGFYLVRTDDLDDLLQTVAMLADADGPVEVRPTVEEVAAS